MTIKQERSGTSRKASWLLLSHQIPSEPAYQRVKIWRHLQALGAIGIKSGAYMLPAVEKTREQFKSLVREIERAGGEAAIFEASLIAGMRDDQIKSLFHAARDEDYNLLAKELWDALQPAKRGRISEERLSGQAAKLTRRYQDIVAIDFFGSTGRRAVQTLLTQLEHRLITSNGKLAAIKRQERPLKGRIWVTRQDVHVDRIACAWLIRRFVDPTPTFKFVTGKSYKPQPGELRFDMANGEFTHEGDKCSFEVLLERAGIVDQALQAIAEVIHDIDIQDGKFGRPETAGISHVISGICMTQRGDEARIARGTSLFDDTYERFRRAKSSK